jgi:hypothetical protein
MRIAHRDCTNSNEAASQAASDLRKTHRLLWSALDGEAAELRQLLAERQEVLEGPLKRGKLGFSDFLDAIQR